MNLCIKCNGALVSYASAPSRGRYDDPADPTIFQRVCAFLLKELDE